MNTVPVWGRTLLMSESEVFLSTEILSASGEAAQVAHLSEPEALVLTYFRQKSQDELVAIHREVSAVSTCRVVMGSDLLTLEI
jgi:ribonuclease BN (tRNA processing enzyme)